MIPRKRLIRHISFFSDLSESELDIVVQSSRNVCYAKGTVVFSRGDPGESLLVVVSGRIKVVLHGEQGEELILTTLGPGSCVGEMSVLDGSPRSATIITIEETAFLQLGRDAVTTLIQHNHSLAMKIIYNLSNRLRERSQQLKVNSMFDVDGKIMLSLIGLGQRDGAWDDGRLIIQPKPPQKDLANITGCAQETASKSVKALKTVGYLTVTRDAYIIEKRGLDHYLDFAS